MLAGTRCLLYQFKSILYLNDVNEKWTDLSYCKAPNKIFGTIDITLKLKRSYDPNTRFSNEEDSKLKPKSKNNFRNSGDFNSS